MRRLPFQAAALVLAATGPLLVSCGKDGQQPVRVVLIGDPSTAAKHGDPAALLLRAATAEGMVALDADGKVIPAVAERWTITDDGSSYIFRLRDSNWPDGTRLTGESVANALRQSLALQRGTPLGLDLAVVDEIRPMASRVVEIRLRWPMPDFLQLLAQPELALLRRNEGTGPMQARRQDGATWLTAIAPEKRGQAMPDDWAQSVRPVTLQDYAGKPQGLVEAVDAMASGRADLLLGGTFADFAQIRSGTFSKLQPRFDPAVGLFGLLAQHADGLLAKPALREALGMVIDRQALASQLGIAGFTPTTRIVAPGQEGDSGANGERWLDYDLAGRQTLASRRIAAWAQAHHSQPELRIALPTGPGADRLAERLTADWAAIGVKAIRVAWNAPADLRLVDEVARTTTPAWFFNRLNCAVHQPCSPEADSIAAKALLATPAEATALNAEAEREYAKANVFIPLGSPVRWSLAANNFPGFSPNRWANHPLFPLANRPR